MIKIGPIFLFLFLTLLCLPEQSMAGSILPRGTIILNRDKPLPPATGEQLDAALKVSQECWTYEQHEKYYDCDCVGMSYLELSRREGTKASHQQLFSEALRLCPNKAGAAGEIYERCLGWAPAEIGQDYMRFCTCYGNEYADLYGKNPSDNQNVREANMTQALTKCKLGDYTLEQQRHSSWLEKLKKQGLYQTLFPDDEPQQ